MSWIGAGNIGVCTPAHSGCLALDVLHHCEEHPLCHTLLVVEVEELVGVDLHPPHTMTLRRVSVDPSFLLVQAPASCLTQQNVCLPFVYSSCSTVGEICHGIKRADREHATLQMPDSSWAALCTCEPLGLSIAVLQTAHAERVGQNAKTSRPGKGNQRLGTSSIACCRSGPLE